MIICEFIGVVYEIVEVGYNFEGCDSVDIFDLVESKVFEIVEWRIGENEGFCDVEFILGKIIDCLEELVKINKDVIGVIIGFIDLDKMISGM